MLGVKTLSMATQDIFLLLTMVQKLKQKLTLDGCMDCLAVLIMKTKESPLNMSLGAIAK